MAQIRIFSHGRARAGEEGRLRELVLELLDSAKADKGTEIYEAFESMDGRDFIFRIQYATRDDFEEHVKNQRLARIMSEVRTIVDGEVSLWNVKPILPG